jgi:predicted PurR-regulated permease PerM
MVARSAYAQLNYSRPLLAVTTVAMILTYLAAPVLAIFASYPANAVAAAAWALMTFVFLPILHFYRVSPLWAAALPLIAAVYLAFTLDSAYQHWRGKGGIWKGRSQTLAVKR